MRYSSGCVVLLLLSIASPAAASIVPTGVHNDVPLNTVLNDWGWTIAYQDTYATDNVPISTVFANVTGDYVMLAAMPDDGSNIIDVLAADLENVVRTYTALNATNTSNDVEWYYNGWSMGFAGLGDTINQSSADINGSSWVGVPNERDRLSWHTASLSSQVPSAIQYGWRSGDNIELNNASNWIRLVLTNTSAPQSPVVPEPASLLVWSLLGIVGLAFSSRRRWQR